MRAVLLLAVLLLAVAGCAAPPAPPPAIQHIHVGDCASCAGFVLVQDQVQDAAQTQQIYGQVGKAMTAERDRASVAPVRSKS